MSRQNFYEKVRRPVKKNGERGAHVMVPREWLGMVVEVKPVKGDNTGLKGNDKMH